jgi:hypothetical protein
MLLEEVLYGGQTLKKPVFGEVGHEEVNIIERGLGFVF